MRKSIFMCLGLLALGGLTFADTASPAAPPKLDAADEKVVNELSKVLRSRIKTSGSELKLIIRPTARASEGYFEDITIQGSPAQLRKLHVSSFLLHAKGIRLDVPYLFKEHKVRTLASTTSMQAVVTEDDLTKTLAGGRRTREMGLKVKYEGNRIRVTGNLNMTLLTGPIEGVAKLRLAPGHKVFMDIQSLKLRGVEVPQFVKDRISSSVNPIVDYTDLPFNPPFRGVRVEGSKATVYT